METGHSHDHRCIGRSREVTGGTVWTQKPGLAQGEQESSLRLRQRGREDVSQMAQFFGNSLKSLIVSALALLSFKHRASKREVSLGPGICGTASGPRSSWGVSKPLPRSSLSDQVIKASFSSSCPRHKSVTRCLKPHQSDMRLDRREPF